MKIFDSTHVPLRSQYDAISDEDENELSFVRHDATYISMDEDDFWDDSAGAGPSHPPTPLISPKAAPLPPVALLVDLSDERIAPVQVVITQAVQRPQEISRSPATADLRESLQTVSNFLRNVCGDQQFETRFQNIGRWRRELLHEKGEPWQWQINKMYVRFNEDMLEITVCAQEMLNSLMVQLEPGDVRTYLSDTCKLLQTGITDVIENNPTSEAEANAKKLHKLLGQVFDVRLRTILQSVPEGAYSVNMQGFVLSLAAFAKGFSQSGHWSAHYWEAAIQDVLDRERTIRIAIDDMISSTFYDNHDLRLIREQFNALTLATRVSFGSHKLDRKQTAISLIQRLQTAGNELERFAQAHIPEN